MFFQFHPILSLSYNLSTANFYKTNEKLPYPTEYNINSGYYDYTDGYGFAFRAINLNFRFWKIITGVSAGADNIAFYVQNYYVGYKAARFTVTAGMANKNIFNAGLVVRL